MRLKKGSPFRSWYMVKQINSGFCGHQSKQQNSKLLKSDGSLTKFDEETGKVFCNYFEKVFNNIRPIDESVLEVITQCEVVHEHGVISLPIDIKSAMKRCDNKKPKRPSNILLVTIWILLMILLLTSGMILTIQMSSMLLYCAFYPNSYNLCLPKSYWVYASWMLPQKLSV